MGILLVLIAFVFFIAAMSQAGECYFCGSRQVTQRTHLGTKGICDRCWCKGKSTQGK